MKKLINKLISFILKQKYSTKRDILSYTENTFTCPCFNGLLVITTIDGILVPVKYFTYGNDINKAFVFAEELKDLIEEKLNY